MKPEPHNINPDLVALARTNGVVKQYIQLYLLETLTWEQSLEMMVLALGKELRAQNDMLVFVQQSESDRIKHKKNIKARKALKKSKQLLLVNKSDNP